jgi:hypothetical protein
LDYRWYKQLMIHPCKTLHIHPFLSIPLIRPNSSQNKKYNSDTLQNILSSESRGLSCKTRKDLRMRQIVITI